jgi:hypothetical protein
MSDLVERMAKACYAAWDAMGSSARGIPAVNWAHIGEDTKEGYRVEARAAMAILIEEAAKVAETAGRQPVGAGDGNTYTIGTALDAAAAIRKLGEK